MSEPIWITGMGAVSSGGWTAEETWQTVVEGRATARRVERFPVEGAITTVAAPVPGLEAAIDEPGSLALRFAERALDEALDDAVVDPSDGADLVVVGNHGERELRLPPEDCTIIGPRELARRLQERTGADGSIAIYGACASGGLAIATAVHLMRSGRASMVIAGGADCLLHDLDFQQFCRLLAMSSRDCPPEEACCPFDKRRDGFVLSEGAAFLVLETAAHATARAATPRAFIEGVGSSQNAYHIVASPPDALGPTRAMAAALRDGGVEPTAVGYINAHGTSTRDNDWCETIAIRNVFQEHADALTVSSSKSELGHPMGAAGAIEAVIAVRVLETGIVPPTINLEEPDPICDLDYVPGSARDQHVDRVVTNSFGFGGHNSSLLLARSA